MELETFVAKSLAEIIDGVKAAKNNGVNVYNHSAKDVDFDVAVTVTEGADKKGGVGVFVAGFGIGAQGSTSASNSSVSRIKFTVPVFLP
jgi:hypothetical protein